MRYSNEPRMRSAVIFSYFLQLLSQSLHLRYVPRNQWLNIAAASQRYLDLEAFVKMAKLLKEDFEPVHKATVNPNKNEKIKRTVGKWQESASGERFDSLQKNKICERKQNGRQIFFSSQIHRIRPQWTTPKNNKKGNFCRVPLMIYATTWPPRSLRKAASGIFPPWINSRTLLLRDRHRNRTHTLVCGTRVAKKKKGSHTLHIKEKFSIHPSYVSLPVSFKDRFYNKTEPNQRQRNVIQMILGPHSFPW